ncbi:MAG: hypothetical protein LBD12_02410 [Clostridiales Family XIII bacterium]|nr:hypothetical protein [Clostridiales Family XIII bacterium]
MIAEHFEIDEAQARPLAEKLFLKAAGFDLEGKEKHQRMYAEALTVREEGLGGIQIQGSHVWLGPDAFDGTAVRVDGDAMEATAFVRIPPEKVHGVVLYVVTAGECSFDDEDNVVRQLYAYMWGTAYVDAGRILMEGLFAKEMPARTGSASCRLSPGFSPGFYGMPNQDSIPIVRHAGGKELGVRCTESGVMVPLKTCSGIFLLADADADFPGEECLVCTSSRGGCSSCMVANRNALNV